MTEKLAPGTKIENRYLIKQALGEGSMGHVYLAFDCRLLRDVAIKFAAEELTDIERQRFVREAQALSKLQHGNVVRCLSVGMHSDAHPYLVLEFVSGQTLAKVLANDGKFSDERAARIMMQICDACSALHAQGLVHRDLKPANMMLTESATTAEPLKLIDFGLVALAPDHAIEMQRLTQAGIAVGTPMYMSPEQCLGKDVDQRADIYSLGCIFFELLTGKYPFSAEQQTVQIMVHHLGQVVPAPSSDTSGSVTAMFDDVIAKSLAKDPAMRFQTMEEFKSAIADAFDHHITSRARGCSKMQLFRQMAAVCAALAYLVLFFQLQEISAAIQRTVSDEPAYARTQEISGHVHEAAESLEERVNEKSFAALSNLEQFALFGELSRLKSLLGAQDRSLQYGAMALQALALGVRERMARLESGAVIEGDSLRPVAAALSVMLERQRTGVALSGSSEKQLSDWFPGSTMSEVVKSILRTTYRVHYSDATRSVLGWLRLLVDEGDESPPQVTETAALDLALSLYVTHDAVMPALGVFDQVSVVVSPAMLSKRKSDLLEAGKLALDSDPRLSSDSQRRRRLEEILSRKLTSADKVLSEAARDGRVISPAFVSQVSAYSLAARNLRSQALSERSINLLIQCGQKRLEQPETPYVLSLFVRDYVANNRPERAEQLISRMQKSGVSVFLLGSAKRSFLIAMQPRVSETEYARLKTLYDADDAN